MLKNCAALNVADRRSEADSVRTPAQAQLAINHPNEALTSALTAYELCIKSTAQTSSAATISALVLSCKKRKWEVRETERLRRRNELLAELELHIETGMKRELSEIDERAERGEMGTIEAEEERQATQETWGKKVEDLRTAFAVSDPEHLSKRVRPYGAANLCFEGACRA